MISSNVIGVSVSGQSEQRDDYNRITLSGASIVPLEQRRQNATHKARQVT